MMHAFNRVRPDEKSDPVQLLIMLVLLAMLPLVLASYVISLWLNTVDVHSSVKAAAIVAPPALGLLLLWTSKAFRILYVFVHAVTLCALMVTTIPDKIWGVIICVPIIALEVLAARWLYRR